MNFSFAVPPLGGSEPPCSMFFPIRSHMPDTAAAIMRVTLRLLMGSFDFGVLFGFDFH